MSVAIDKKKTTEDSKKEWEKDHQMVKGIFRCMEPAGGSITFSFLKYKGDQVLHYTMIDGVTYTVPRMVATHLNKNCSYPIHSHLLDADGNQTVQVGRKVKRCSFESLEFAEE